MSLSGYNFGIHDPFPLKKTSQWDISFQRGASLDPILSWRRIRVVQVFVSQPYYPHSPTFLLCWILIYRKHQPSRAAAGGITSELWNDLPLESATKSPWEENSPLPLRFLKSRFPHTGRFKFQPINSAERSGFSRWRKGHGGVEVPAKFYRWASHVSSFWFRPDGSLVFRQVTSRSGQDKF